MWQEMREVNGAGRSEEKITWLDISRDLKQTLKWPMESYRRRLFADVSALSSSQATIHLLTAVCRSCNWLMNRNEYGLSLEVCIRCWFHVQMIFVGFCVNTVSSQFEWSTWLNCWIILRMYCIDAASFWLEQFVSIEKEIHVPLLVPSSDGVHFGLQLDWSKCIRRLFLVRMQYTCPVLVCMSKGLVRQFAQ